MKKINRGVGVFQSSIQTEIPPAKDVEKVERKLGTLISSTRAHWLFFSEPYGGNLYSPETTEQKDRIKIDV